MKVISSPDIESWKCVCRCGTCTSELEVNADDLLFKIEKRWVSGDDWGGGSYQNYDYYYVVCPKCDKEVAVRIGDIPYLLKDKTQKKCAKTK